MRYTYVKLLVGRRRQIFRRERAAATGRAHAENVKALRKSPRCGFRLAEKVWCASVNVSEKVWDGRLSPNYYASGGSIIMLPLMLPKKFGAEAASE